MTKIVYNACYGGFGLSKEALARYNELKGSTADWYDVYDISRHDPCLVQVVEEMINHNGEYSELQIVELPEGTAYRIDEYDGLESVRTCDDYEWSIA